jgi:tripartite-type tricarboxylate transporter receptor subunit TctC
VRLVSAVASPLHMASLRFTLMPHPGSAQVLAELLPGEADATADPAPSSMPHVRAGRLLVRPRFPLPSAAG